jgi:hypothetical protein
MSFFLAREVGACASRVRVYRIARSPDASSARIVPDTIGHYPVRGRVPTTSVGVTRPASLLRAHAPDHVPPTFFGCPSVRGSRQVAAGPCCDVVLPDVSSAHLSPRAWPPTPVARVVHMPVSSQTTSAFPPLGTGRRSTISPPATSGGTPISRLQSCTHVQARRFAHYPGRSYRYGFPYGSHGFSVRASRKSLPPYASDMLPVRIGQLTGWGLAPHEMCSLAGCCPIMPGHLYGDCITRYSAGAGGRRQGAMGGSAGLRSREK